MTDGEHPDLSMILRYVLHRRVEAYVAVGWIDHGPLPFPHGFYSNLCEWPLQNGEPVEPEDDHEERK